MQDLRDILMSRTRLQALENANILDTPIEEVYDGQTAKLSEELGAPVTMMSIIDMSRQFIKSHKGLPPELARLRETPLHESMCQNVIQSADTFAVSDLREDPMFFQHPVLRNFNVIAYLGEPLIYEGEIIGTVCAYDFKPHKWSDKDIAALKERTRIIQEQLNQKNT